jgi:Uma2 family endonuclease
LSFWVIQLDSIEWILVFLAALFQLYLEKHAIGRVLPAPFQMKLRNSGREPDLLFVATERLDRLRENHLEGPADLAVEIVSRDSGARDRGDKFFEYEREGVREYWLLEPIRRRAEFYRQGPGGYYVTVAAGEDNIFRSEVLPGFWVRTSWLWQDPLPLTAAVKELGLL